MKALRFSEFGPTSVLRIEEITVPEPEEGEALIQVKAAATSPAITRTCRGTSTTQLCREDPDGTLRASLSKGSIM